MNMNGVPERLVTVKEACAYLRVGRTKIYQLINAGKIVAYDRNGRTFIDLDSVDAYNAATLKRIPPKDCPEAQAA
ncbi:helix-turn-helix domain-containing protein [Bradyrhizobium japonicum]|nr:helix-turn-helix domain-containing protein [Bradyrhizobium japonicum]